MKNLNGIKKIAIKVSNSDFGVYNVLIGSMPSAKKLLIEPGLTAFLLPDGTAMELYGPGSIYPDYLFAASDTVMSYKVDKLDEALTALMQAGAQLLGSIQEVCSSYRYCHLQLNDQSVLGIYEEAISS
jgi:hypothetical protein